jgi:sulfonate transport system ATP-binding protein
VSLRHANRTFGVNTVLHEVDIEIEPGEVVALLGSSGSGKSTLRRLVAGLDRPTDGPIELDGKSLNGIDPRCAMVFQEPRLLPWRSLAATNSVYPDAAARAPRPAIDEEAKTW